MAAIFLIDCDGIRKLGSPPALTQADTLDWDDPHQPKAGPDLDTDRYKLALLVGRVLTIGKDIRPGGHLRLVPDLPKRVAERVTILWQWAAGARGTRPDAYQWAIALSNRDEIPLPPVTAVRKVPALPLQPLDGDKTTTRPVIKLSPCGGTYPAPRPSS